MFIKVCGMTTSDAIEAACAAGVDAVGFVFAPSIRRVTPKGAAQLVMGVRSGVLKVAVTHHPEQTLVDEIVAAIAPDYLQTDIEDFQVLKVPATVQRLPVLRASQEFPVHLPTRVLFEGPVSGTGKTGDWDGAAQLAMQTEVILAGGLNATNVAAAVARVRPFGVDVSTGVERRPGVKDPAKIQAFVRAVRQAARER
jgi:phosphoribosylanthranilate isomerase